MTDQDMLTLDEMEKRGGSFVRAMAQACRHADASNLYRMKQAFPEYFEQYKVEPFFRPD